MSSSTIIATRRSARHGWDAEAGGTLMLSVIVALMAGYGVGMTEPTGYAEPKPGFLNYSLWLAVALLVYLAFRRAVTRPAPQVSGDELPRSWFRTSGRTFEVLLLVAAGFVLLAAAGAGQGQAHSSEQGTHINGGTVVLLALSAVPALVAVLLLGLRWTPQGRQEASVARWWSELGPAGRRGAGLAHHRLSSAVGSPAFVDDGRVSLRLPHAGHGAWNGLGGGDLSWFGLGLVVRGAAALYNYSQRDRLAAEARQARLADLRAADAQLVVLVPRQRTEVDQLAAAARRRLWLRGRAERAAVRHELSVQVQDAVRAELAAG